MKTCPKKKRVENCDFCRNSNFHFAKNTKKFADFLLKFLDLSGEICETGLLTLPPAPAMKAADLGLSYFLSLSVLRPGLLCFVRPTLKNIS